MKAAVNWCIAVSVGVIAPAACTVNAAGLDSVTYRLQNDVSVSAGQPQQVLSGKVSGNQNALIVSDGVVAPDGGKRIAIYLTLDGAKISNESIIDWRDSKSPVPHSFRVIAALNVPGGAHSVSVIAKAEGHFHIVRSSSLAVMTHPAVQALSMLSGAMTDPVNAMPLTREQGDVPQTLTCVATLELKASDGPIIMLAAGSSEHAQDYEKSYGDAMWAFKVDGRELSPNEGNYSVNDLYSGAEIEAPMFIHGVVINSGEGRRTVCLGATSQPWPSALGPNKVRYRVAPRTALVVLNRGIKLYGGVSNYLAKYDHEKRFAFQCVGSSEGWRGCPAVNSDVTIAAGRITIPKDHNGIVFVSAITRVQGDHKDVGGMVSLWITVDGVWKGAVAQQGLAFPSSESTRTVSASVLTSGADALAPGDHEVALHARAEGKFKHLSVTKDLPLIWFD